MADEVTYNWTDFKALSVAKKFGMQFQDTGDNYYIWFVEDIIKYSTVIVKETPAGTDQADFENNYKANANKAIEPKSSDGQVYVRNSPKSYGKTLKIKGFGITCPPNQDTTYDIKFTSDIELIGGEAECTRMDFDDKINFKAIDKDNVLGYGAGFVLNQFIIDSRGLGENHVTIAKASSTDLFPSYFYLRLIFTNSHATDEKKLVFNLEYYA
jgi:hypothetical protein